MVYIGGDATTLYFYSGQTKTIGVNLTMPPSSSGNGEVVEVEFEIPPSGSGVAAIVGESTLRFRTNNYGTLQYITIQAGLVANTSTIMHVNVSSDLGIVYHRELSYDPLYLKVQSLVRMEKPVLRENLIVGGLSTVDLSVSLETTAKIFEVITVKVRTGFCVGEPLLRFGGPSVGIQNGLNI